MRHSPARGEIWFVDFPDDPKSRPARSPLGNTISPGLMRQIEHCLLRSLDLAT